MANISKISKPRDPLFDIFDPNEWADDDNFSRINPFNDGKAPCKIHFLIIGGGIAGLSAAIALRRVGHYVTVLETDDGKSRAHLSAGCRMPPNLTKIYNHWGLAEALRKIAVKSDGVTMCDLSTSETIGIQIWRVEMLQEARAEFEFTHHHKLRRVLHDKALELGALVYYDCRVASIDPASATVTLDTGEVLKGDAIIGADGPNGVCRSHVLQEDDEPHRDGKFTMYNTVVSKQAMMDDPDLRSFYEGELTQLYSWFGDRHAALGYSIGEEFALHLYTPAKDQDGEWGTLVGKKELASFYEIAEPRLKKLIDLARDPVKIACKEFSQVAEWVHPSGKMVVIGDAVHPLTPGGLQNLAMAVEDGAVLARLFSHLPRKSRIGSFMWAFQDLRRDRCAEVRETEAGNLVFMAMPTGDVTKIRDEVMRRKLAQNKNALDPDSDDESDDGNNAYNEWMAIMRIFCYDAEDEADNWWVEWGLLRERSEGLRIPSLEFDIDSKELGTDDSTDPDEIFDAPLPIRYPRVVVP